MTVLTDKPEVGRTNVALLAEGLAEIYSTRTPKGWPEPKKVSNLYLINCVSFTIAGVQYLYLEPKYESYSSTTHYILRYRIKHFYLKITLTLIFPFL